MSDLPFGFSSSGDDDDREKNSGDRDKPGDAAGGNPFGGANPFGFAMGGQGPVSYTHLTLPTNREV